MGFHIEFSDIVKYEGDAIVNSLGVDGSVYGRLCKNIIEAAKSESIINFINNKKNNNIGELFITDAGELPSKKIFHVVTPFKHLDDSKNSKLTEAYKKVIDTVLIHGYKSIALPFIGTGANGYSDKDSYDAITKACEYLLEYEEKVKKDVLEVTIIGYLKDSSILSSGIVKEYEHNLKREVLYESRLYRSNLRLDTKSCSLPGFREEKSSSISSEKAYKVLEVEKCLRAISCYDPYDCIPLRKIAYKAPYDFIKDYLKHKGKTDKIFKRYGITPDGKYKLSIRQAFQKKTIYKLAFMCGMNLPELVQFMMICEVTFSPYSKLDLFMIDYFRGHIYKCNHPLDFAALVKKYTDVEIFCFAD